MNKSTILAYICTPSSFREKLDLQRYSQSRRPHGSGPFHDLPGTIPSFRRSNREAVNGGTASGGHSCHQYFWERPVTKEPAALWIALLEHHNSTY